MKPQKAGVGRNEIRSLGTSKWEIPINPGNQGLSTTRAVTTPCLSPELVDKTTRSGPNSEVLLKRPTERKIQKGDMILIDLATRYGTYASNVGRGIVFAGTKEQKRIAEVAVRAFEQGLKKVRPSIKVSEIYMTIKDIIKQGGYEEFFKESTGHGIGMDPEEEIPFITPQNEMIIQPNMTFCLKSAIMVPGHGGIRVEDVVVARETEAKLLTTFDRRLFLE